MIFAIAILSPLVGCLLAGLLGRSLGDRFAFVVTIGFMALATICAEANAADVLYTTPQPDPVVLGTWFDIGGFQLDWALRRGHALHRHGGDDRPRRHADPHL